MDYSLHPDAKIALRPAVTENAWCVHTGNPIRSGKPAVVVWSPGEWDDTREISIGAVEGLIGHLEKTIDGNVNVNCGVANDSKIKFARISEEVTCLVCQKSVEAGTVALSFYTPEAEAHKGRGIHRPSPLRCHQSCIPAVVNGLQGVWSYTDELLGRVA